jgi:Phosphodiester glycosidase
MMVRCWRAALPLVLLVVAATAAAQPTPSASAEAGKTPWVVLEEGLELGTFVSPQSSSAGDSRIRVLRIDTQRFELHLFNASGDPSGRPLTAREWAKEHGLVAAINASMYQADYEHSVALMRTRTHVNNPRLSRDNAVLAFDRLDTTVPPVQIIDRTCQDFDSLRSHYGTLVQSIRMISCRRTNVWTPREEKWSTAAIGIDAAGRILFIHVGSPYSTHDLIDVLLSLPLGLVSAMYVEGGPQAQLFIDSGGREEELIGSHGLSLADSTLPALPIPNVIGVLRRPSSETGVGRRRLGAGEDSVANPQPPTPSPR